MDYRIIIPNKLVAPLRASCIFFVLVSSFCQSIFPQSQKIIPVSPEAAALAKMVNYPVDLNTGVPGISIPLYEIEAGGLKLPVSLSYHAGGFQINERSTRVGLGWSLSTDLQITRTVNGLDDFKSVDGYIANAKMTSYGPGREYPLWANSPFMGRNAYDIAAGNVDGMPDKFNYRLLGKSGSFYFQKNQSGNGYVIMPVPFDNIKITFNDNKFTIIDTDGTTYIFGSEGSVSLTNAANSGHELSGEINSNEGVCIDCVISAWKCKEIVNATQTDRITFSYEKKAAIQIKRRPEFIEYYNNGNPCGLSRYIRADHLSNEIDSYEELLRKYPFYYLSSPKYIEHFADSKSLLHLPYFNEQNALYDKTFEIEQSLPNLSAVTVSGLALTSIEFRGGSVVFSGADQLVSIRILNANNTEIKSFKFYQSYTQPLYLQEAKITNGQSFMGTLYLDSILLGKGNDVFERYKLLYKHKYCFGDHLKGSDAWGYSNQFTQERYVSRTSITVPYQQIKQRYYRNVENGCVNTIEDASFNIGNPTNIEEPERDAAQRGILKRIVYPTGGYVDFDFESNKYGIKVTSQRVQIPRMAGGLRIRSINFFDGEAILPISQKYYTYGDLEDGIGILINAPSLTFDARSFGYKTFSTAQTVSYLTGPEFFDSGDEMFPPLPSNCNTRECLKISFQEKRTTYRPISSLNYTYSNGSPIYYTKVTEYNHEKGQKTGKIVHTFYKPNDFEPYLFYSDNKVPGTDIDILQADGLMGEEKLLEEFKYENGKYLLIHAKESVYSKYTRPEHIKVVYSFLNTIYRIESGEFLGSEIDLYNRNYQFATSPYSADIEYTAGEYGIQVGKLLLTGTKDKWINANDSVSVHTAYYYDNSNFLQPSRIVTTDSKGYQASRFLKYSYDYGGVDVYDQMRSKNMLSQVIEEIDYNNTLSKEISRSKTNYSYFSSGPGFFVPKTIEKSYGGEVPDTVLHFDLYDLRANVLQLREKNAIIKSYLYGYNNKYPIAEVIGIPYSEVSNKVDVNALQTVTNEVELNTVLASLRDSLRKAMVNTFTYNPLIGLASKTDEKGLRYHYKYDSFNRLESISNQNNQVIKKYNYFTTEPDISVANPNYYVNIPIMETFYKRLTDNSIISYNYTENGGKHLAFDSFSANATAESSLDSLGPLSAPSNVVGKTGLVKLILTCFYEVYPIPEDAHLDIIKDGSVVASSRFSSDYFSPKLVYLPPGNYQLSVRQDNNFNGSTTVCYVYPEYAAQIILKQGEAFDFEGGKPKKFIRINRV